MLIQEELYTDLTASLLPTIESRDATGTHTTFYQLSPQEMSRYLQIHPLNYVETPVSYQQPIITIF